MSLWSQVGKAITSLFGGSVKPAPPTKPSGSDGEMAYSGYLASGEASPELQATRKWVTFANAKNVAIVATGLRYYASLLAGTEWHCEPNEAGGADAERGAEIVEQGLLEAQMPKPWSAIVRKAAMYRFDGFSLHEWIVKRRSDGMLVYADLQHRPQYTIVRWDKPSEQEPWHGVQQQSRSGQIYVVPRNRLFYCVDDTLTDSPEGVGLLRHIVEIVNRLTLYQTLEGVAFETDLRGTPLGRAPLAQIKNEGKDEKDVDAYILRRTQVLRSLLQDVFKSPDKHPYLMLDSEPYRGADPDVISTIQKWSFELLKGDTNGLPEIHAVINRLQFEIARVLGIEFAMVGQSGGSYSMHEDKTAMFATNLQTTLTEIAAFAENDLARTLVAMNGLDPETCTPRLVAEPISTDAIEAVCRSLSFMAQAGLAPNDPARNVLRNRMHLPPEPQLTPEALGLLGRGNLGGPPAPELGEQEVLLDDLGDTSSSENDRVTT